MTMTERTNWTLPKVVVTVITLMKASTTFMDVTVPFRTAPSKTTPKPSTPTLNTSASMTFNWHKALRKCKEFHYLEE